MFQGFTERTFDFLWELQINNERSWFNDHKEEFIRVLKDPFGALAAETLELLQQRFPKADFQVHVSRIYRDARRLYGRGPYQDNLWFSIQRGDNRARGPRFWFEIDTEGYGHGLGFWDASADFTAAYRKMIDAHPARFTDLIESLPDREKLLLTGQEYKRPKGDLGPEINSWYNRKDPGVMYQNHFEKAIYTDQMPRLLADAYTALMPLYDFFLEAYRLAGEEEEDRL